MAQRLMVQRLLVRRLWNHGPTGHCRSRTVVKQKQHDCRATSWIHATAAIYKSKDDTNTVAPQSEEQANLDDSKTSKQPAANNNSDDDEIPEWQNPLHHNNPDRNKIFVEDFADGEEMPIVPLPPIARPGSNVLAPDHIHDLADEILQLNMIEMRQLVDKVADHFGFDTQAVAMSLGGAGAAGGGGEGDEGDAAKEEAPAEEKTLFDLKLVGFDAKAKIKVIKEVRAIAGLGLKEAKELVEGAPKVVKKDIKKEEAEELQKKLEEVGATIEVV